MNIQNCKILKGASVQLEPLNETHKNDLYHAAQDEKIWVFNSVKGLGEQFYRWFDKAIKRFELNEHLPFIVRRLSDQQIIGSTRFYDINFAHQKLAIGYTWYVPAVWGTQVNPECKLLLLTLAFEELRLNRVEFFIDSRHLHSRAALKKLGAVEEGVLRQHLILNDGFIRDSIVFSIIKPEWDSVKSTLLSRLK